jgi:two-component system, NtrC family, sensor kinase
MKFAFKLEALQNLFWRIYVLIAVLIPAAFLVGYFKPPRDEFSWLILFFSLYILVIFFLFFYLQSVFSRENINKMAEISSIAEDLQAEKMASLETLASGIAHELNNPLGIILGFNGLLLEKAEPDSQAFKDLQAIERQGLNCQQVVNNLLSFSRLKEDIRGLVDINQVIEKLLTVVGPGLHAQGISIECSLAEGLPHGPGNPQKWQQIILNLVNNAKTAMPEGGKLSIWTASRKTGKVIEIGFRDTGRGVPEELQNRIFDPFFTTKKEGRGIGLGLSIAYGIITNLGGAIQCQSTLEDTTKKPKGTTFIISMPIQEGAPLIH